MVQDLANFIDELTGGSEPGFRSEPWYNPDGDCIHYRWVQGESYADWVDDKLTVYRSEANGAAVGLQIKGVTALLEKFGDFGVSAHATDGTPLALFMFVWQATSRPSDDVDALARVRTYQYLIEQVGSHKVALPELLAA